MCTLMKSLNSVETLCLFPEHAVRAGVEYSHGMMKISAHGYHVSLVMSESKKK